jgi:predicted DNA-binding transcriptional regulator AlpA
MISPDALERLVEQDTCAEMLALLEPEELVVASLRLEGLSDLQIGALLDTDSRSVAECMDRVRLRIMEALPELAPFLRGRQCPGHWPVSRQSPPLERGWLCGWAEGRDEAPPDPGLRAQDVAQRYGVTVQTVCRWVREGRFPNAYRVTVDRGAYRIPEKDLNGFQPGRRKRLERRPGGSTKRRGASATG